MYQQSVKWGSMGVLNINPSLLLADSCLNIFELHILNYFECLEKCYIKYQNEKNICSNLYEPTHISSKLLWPRLMRHFSVFWESSVYSFSLSSLTPLCLSRMWRYSERWSWASWKEDRTSTRPCASSLASTAMRSSPASPWLVSDRYDMADQVAFMCCVMKNIWVCDRLCCLLRKILRPFAWQRSGEDWSSWRWVLRSI